MKKLSLFFGFAFLIIIGLILGFSLTYLIFSVAFLTGCLLLSRKLHIVSDFLDEIKEREEFLESRSTDNPEKTGYLKQKKVHDKFKFFYNEIINRQVIFLSILIFFTLFKLPYYNLSFSGEVTIKYNTHVERAVNMYNHNDPFRNQRKYNLSDFINNPEGISRGFGEIPLMEWGLLGIFYLFPSNSYELNTRIFMHISGVLTIIFIYLFFRRYLTKSESLLIAFFVSINPAFNVTFYATVLDSILFLFTFISLFFLDKYLDKDGIVNLYIAALISGLGVVIKHSLFLWLTPIALVLIYFKLRKTGKTLATMLIFLLLSLVLIPIHRYSLRLLPVEPISSLVRFFFFSAALTGLLFLISRIMNWINYVIIRITSTKYLRVFSLIIGVLIGYYFIVKFRLYRFSDSFLTDSELLFDPMVYYSIIKNSILHYLTGGLFFLGLFGFILSFLLKNKKRKYLMVAFLAGCFFYLVAASKSIYFHNYYLNIFMVSFIFGAVSFIFSISVLFDKKIPSLILLVFLVLLAPGQVVMSSRLLGTERQDNYFYRQLVNYIITNTNENDIFIDDSSLMNLCIHTGRGRIEERHLLRRDFIESLNQRGFSESLKKYNVRFLITTRKTPRYEYFANLFTDKPLLSTRERRTDIILSEIYDDRDFFSDMEIRQNIISEMKIAEKFVLIKEIGPYRIFGFAN